MSNLDFQELSDFIQDKVVRKFYDNRMKKLKVMKLRDDILSKKNPYLFRAKNVSTPQEFVKGALDAFLSSQEETMFGNLMEDLVVYVCNLAYGGKKAEAKKFKSVDLVFEHGGTYYIVSIKSGPRWGNKDQLDRMKSNFKKAKEILRSEGVTLPIVAVNGCIYGKEPQHLIQDLDDPEQSYIKMCGQDFWSFISGADDLYLKLIDPIAPEAEKRDPEFKTLYTQQLNTMTLEFGNNFMTNGFIDWKKIVEFVSKREQAPPTPPATLAPPPPPTMLSGFE